VRITELLSHILMKTIIVCVRIRITITIRCVLDIPAVPSTFRRQFRPQQRIAWVCTSLLMAAPAAKADPGTDTQTIVITGTRTEKTLADTPLRTEVVTREEIDRTQARTLKDALQNVPGLQLREVHGKSGFEVSLQGMSSDQVLVLIDGLPISSSTGSTQRVRLPENK